MITVNCLYCGRAILTHPSLVSRKKFCSRSCLARSKTGSNARNFKDGRTILRLTCQQCGREFVGAVRNRFCSRECFLAARPPTFHTCPQCGQRFGPVDHRGRKFCSKGCAYKAHTTGRRTFRGTITKARRAQRLVRYCVVIGLLERPVTCEECGSTGQAIEAAHHNYDEPVRIRWLCRSCHRRWDKREPKHATFVIHSRDFAGVDVDGGGFLNVPCQEDSISASLARAHKSTPTPAGAGVEGA